MLYYLFEYLDKTFNIPGAGVFQFITFRAAMAVIVSLIISAVFGKRIIAMLLRKQVGETVRDLGLDGQLEKQGTPTMGGIIILSSIIIPTLLFAKLENVYILMMLLVTVGLGLVGFVDDYIKVFKKNKEGLAGKFKILGQVIIGLIVGSVLYFNEDVKIRDYATIYTYELQEDGKPGDLIEKQPSNGVKIDGKGLVSDMRYYSHDGPSMKTTIPFLKNNEFNYSSLLGFLENPGSIAWIIFIPIVIIIITAVSNGANITDGIDGLATGTSAIIGGALAVFAYISGNVILAQYLNVMYIPGTGELMIFSAAFIGACVGFLWYNAFPAQVFMGDTGSLALGGIIACLAIIIRKELLIPVMCGIFLVENLSVMIQVGYFKYTKRKFGEGRRVFKMAPLHHHYQKLGFHESKIVSRFWVIGMILAIVSVVTLKLR
jgi:phospho-N-acetylmuramoyl-pentapeptide-transferase